jgi:hypothetical protein
MKQSDTARFARVLTRLMWLGAGATLTVIGAYAYKFVWQTGEWQLSPSKSEWGTFGDFVGGTLNPYFSFLAFIGVVFTVILQSKQLDTMKAQTALEEMQRVQSSIARRIDGLLAAPMNLNPEKFRTLAENPQSVFDLIAALGTLQLKEPKKDEVDWMKWAWDAEAAAGLKAVLESQTVALRLEFDALGWMLCKYEASGGTEVVMEYYRYRYLAILVWLDSLGLIESHGWVQKFFTPKEKKQYMTS